MPNLTSTPRLVERVVELADLVLGLRDGHAVARHDHHLAGRGEDRRRLLGRRALDRPRLLAAGGLGLLLAERPEEHVGERPVHRLRHVDRQDEARGAVERPGDDQQLVVEHEAHRRGRQPGVGIEQRDHRRHVGAADRDDHQHAEKQGRSPAMSGKSTVCVGMKDQEGGDADGETPGARG